MDLTQYIGNEIKRRRKEQKLSGKALGEKIFTSEGTVYRIEHGYSKDVSIKNLYAIANGLKCSIFDILPYAVDDNGQVKEMDWKALCE